MRWLNVLAFVVTVVVNSLAGSGILNGISTGEISDKYDTQVALAICVFAIWSVVYLLLAVFVVSQALPSHRGKPFQKRMSLFLSNIFNCTWIPQRALLFALQLSKYAHERV